MKVKVAKIYFFINKNHIATIIRRKTIDKLYFRSRFKKDLNINSSNGGAINTPKIKIS